MLQYEDLMLYVYRYSSSDNAYELYSVVEEPIYVSYNPTYNNGGTFKLKCKTTEQNTQTVLKNTIIRIEPEIAGIVKSIQTSADGTMSVGGTLGDSFLSQKAMMGSVDVENKSPGQIISVVYGSMEAIPAFNLQDSSPSEHLQTGTVEPENFLSLVQKLCQNYDLGYTITCNDLGDNLIDFTMEVYAGADRTEEIFLSQTYGNLSDFEYTVNSDDEINFVRILGEDNTIVDVMSDPAPSLIEKREHFLDCTGVKKESLTDAQYRAILTEKGLEVISSHKQKETFSGDCNSQIYQIGADYFVGDIVSVYDIYRDIQTQQRAVGYTKSFDTSGVYISADYGEIQNRSSKVISNMKKRIEKLEEDKTKAKESTPDSNGVGQYMDTGKTSERFNDYRKFDAKTKTGGNSSGFKYDHIEGFNNHNVLPAGVREFRYNGYNHIEGFNNTLNGAEDSATHIEGSSNNVTESGYNYNHVEGMRNTVNGCKRTRVGGQLNIVNVTQDVAVFGTGNTVSGATSGTVVCGNNNTVQGVNIAHAGVFGDSHSVTASGFICGQEGTLDGTQVFAVASSGSGNIFEVRPATLGVFAAGYHSLGADYAEYFEWYDGNPEGEDRCGMLVTLDGDKLIPAHGDDIFGIVSAAPSVVGNAYETHWHGKYVLDVYGRTITTPSGEPLLSPDFDPSRKYIPRSKRKEWAPVGLVGALVTRDNGVCIPGDYCAAKFGTVIPSSSPTKIRVLKRVNERCVKVLIQ